MSASLKVLKSAALLLNIQIIQRGLGTISTLILARLLTPEHFGIIALVVMAIQFFELLVETGSQQYIIQKKTLSNEDLNTAWSMDVLSKSVLALIIIISSPLAAHYFETPELALALSVSALTLPVRALKNPGMMQLAREIDYQPFFRLNLWQKGLSFITVITLAFINPNHWAIISGNLVSATVLAGGSYYVHSFRPVWSLRHVRQQWMFSRWLLLRGITGFIRSQIDSLMVSKLFGTEKLGGYNLVREIGLLPAITIINPMMEPLLSALAQEKGNAAALSYRTRLSLWVVITLITPITVFIMSYPSLIVLVLLGENWQDFALLLRPFGLAFFSFCLFALICDAMIAQGKVKLLFFLDLISTALIISILVQTGTADLMTMAWARSWLAIVTAGCYLLILNHQVSFGIARLAWLCIPSAAGSAAALTLINTLPLESTSSPLWTFLIKGTLYVLVAVAVTIGAALALLRNHQEWSHIRYIVDTLRNKQSKQ